MIKKVYYFLTYPLNKRDYDRFGLKIMEQNGFDVSMLFGEPAIYGKSGWQTLSAFGIETNFELAIKSESTVRDACLKDDLDWLEKIHASHVSDYTGPFKRTHKYWKKWVHLRINASKRNFLKIVEKNGAKSGYFALKADQTICEIGWAKIPDRILCWAR